MKKWTLILAVLIPFSLLAQEVNFMKNPEWQKVLDKAKKEQKYIFLDAYTDWCGWCKVMDKETFTNPEVARMLNDRFIPVKMEMETGYGIKLAMKYNVSGFPSFLIFNPEGNLVYSMIGYMKAEPFLEELHKGLNETTQMKFPGYSKKVDMKFPAFYEATFQKKRTWPKEEEVVAYLEKQKPEDLFNEINWGIINKLAIGEKYEQYFLENREKYAALYGGLAVERRTLGILYSKLNKAIKEKDEAAMEELISGLDEYIEGDVEMTKMEMRTRYYQKTENWSRMAELVQEMINVEGYENTNAINSFAWDIYEKAEDPEALMKAEEWMKEVIAIEPNYMFLDTYAALLYKNKKYDEAAKYAEMAIETGKKSGENVAETQELLEKIYKESGRVK